EHVIWDGAVKDSIWSEASHLYKIDGRYYLLTAEGGTAMDHAVMVARADEVTGPYRGSPSNPVLTHHDLAAGHPIVGTGHGNRVETPDGGWWKVQLGMRLDHGERCDNRRETHLVHVAWEDGGSMTGGRVEPRPTAPALPPHPWPAVPLCDQVDGPELAP